MIVVDQISPVTPPSIRRLLHPGSRAQYKTSILTGKNRSLSKLVHLNHCAGKFNSTVTIEFDVSG